MKVAIYSRKSKFTGKGESIDNQINMCKDYCSQKFNTNEFSIYEDEGFSGGNIDRPQFKLMIEDAKKGLFDAVVCYKLDRISRNVSDFSKTLDLLRDNNIAFISITEQFDTTSPIGRAMTYIASVFAQLERETIAERIRDNMLQLAKTGRWLGGTTPTGFESVEVSLTDHAGKVRKAFKLSPIPEEIELIKLIFKKFLELKILTQVETYLIQHEIKTKNDSYFTRFTLRTMLNNPVYATADEILYNYLDANKYEIYADKDMFNGTKGIMAYNKTIQKKNQSNKLRDSSEWIIAVAEHDGIIESSKWIEAQELINQNKSKTFRKVRSQDALLSGILKCAECGSYMRPKQGRLSSDGQQVFYYLCEMKEKSKRTKCSCKNAHGPSLDKAIEDYLKSMSSKKSDIRNKLYSEKLNVSTQGDAVNKELVMVQEKIKNNDAAINNLVSTLSQSQNTAAGKYIVDQINNLDEENNKLKTLLLELSKKSAIADMQSNEYLIIDEMISSFGTTFATTPTIEGKRALVKLIIDNILWDGENVDIVLFGSGTADT